MKPALGPHVDFAAQGVDGILALVLTVSLGRHVFRFLRPVLARDFAHRHGHGFHQRGYFFDAALGFAQWPVHADTGDLQVNSFAGHGWHMQAHR